MHKDGHWMMIWWCRQSMALSKVLPLKQPRYYFFFILLYVFIFLFFLLFMNNLVCLFMLVYRCGMGSLMPRHLWATLDGNLPHILPLGLTLEMLQTLMYVHHIFFIYHLLISFLSFPPFILLFSLSKNQGTCLPTAKPNP